MKKTLLTLFAIILLAGTACQEKIDIEKEKEAIMAVIQEEGDAAAAMDMERLLAVHVQDNLDARLQTRENDYTIYAGWDEIKALFKIWEEIGWSVENPKNFKENVILKVTDGSAWLICDNIWKWTYEGEPGGMDNIEITFLEKIEGKWKISFTAYITKPEPEKEVEEGEGEPEPEELESEETE